MRISDHRFSVRLCITVFHSDADGRGYFDLPKCRSPLISTSIQAMQQCYTPNFKSREIEWYSGLGFPALAAERWVSGWSKICPRRTGSIFTIQFFLFQLAQQVLDATLGENRAELRTEFERTEYRARDEWLGIKKVNVWTPRKKAPG